MIFTLRGDAAAAGCGCLLGCATGLVGGDLGLVGAEITATGFSLRFSIMTPRSESILLLEEVADGGRRSFTVGVFRREF